MRPTLLVTAVAYAALLFATEPTFVADTPDMAISAVAKGLGNYCEYLEPGHLLWRPTGHALLAAFGTMQPGASTDVVLQQSQIQLGWAAAFSGLLAILLCAAWLLRRTGDVAGTGFGIAVVLVSKAFVNFSQVGVSYIPALACLMGALLLLSANDDRPRPSQSVAAGILLGMSVLMWGTFVMAVPAALASPLIFASRWREGIRPALFAIAGGAAVAVAGAVWVVVSLGFTSAGELSAWAATADHGIAVGGIPRAVLGFARSYLETGDYGRLVKRFLIGDPTDPVSIRDLIGFPLIGILGFYAGLLVALIVAYRNTSGRRALVFLAVNAIPVAAFAIAWQGGDLERYLPLLPGMALLLAAAFGAASRTPRIVFAAWLGMIIIPNALALSAPAVARQNARMQALLRGVEEPGRARLLVFSHWQDERVQYNWNRRPTSEPLPVRFYHLVSPGNPSIEAWPSEAAERIVAAWDAGAEVLVSERLLAPVAGRDWQWVEGDDDRVSWADFHRFFTSLGYGPRVGAPGDGFVPLPPNPANRAALESHRTSARGLATPPGCRMPETIPRDSGV